MALMVLPVLFWIGLRGGRGFGVGVLGSGLPGCFGRCSVFMSGWRRFGFLDFGCV